jgi:hypothetical protein
LVNKFTNIIENLELKIADNKSGWIKKDGNWLKEWKFLGIIYDPIKNEVKSPKTNGTGLEFTYSSQPKTFKNVGMSYWLMKKKEWKLEQKIWNKLINYLYNPENDWHECKSMLNNLPKKQSFKGLNLKWGVLNKKRTKGKRINFTIVHSDIYGYIMFKTKL